MVCIQPLEKRQDLKRIKGVGCHIPVKRKTRDKVMGIFRRDMESAGGLAGQNGNSSYFLMKKEAIRAALEKFGRETAGGRRYEVGYAPGRRFIYPGLPVEFAAEIDPAIVETMELVAKCRDVAMTGACCSGHPSKIIANPYLAMPEKDKREANLAGMHNYEGYMYAQNRNPILIVVFYNDNTGKALASNLESASTPEECQGAGMGIKARRVYVPQFSPDFLTVRIEGMVTLHPTESAIEHGDFIRSYQDALASFWAGIKAQFQKMAGAEAPDPKPSQFTPARTCTWDDEYPKFAERRANGKLDRVAVNGFKVPHYYMFSGLVEYKAGAPGIFTL